MLENTILENARNKVMTIHELKAIVKLVGNVRVSEVIDMIQNFTLVCDDEKVSLITADGIREEYFSPVASSWYVDFIRSNRVGIKKQNVDDDFPDTFCRICFIVQDEKLIKALESYAKLELPLSKEIKITLAKCQLDIYD